MYMSDMLLLDLKTVYVVHDQISVSVHLFRITTVYGLIVHLCR